MDSKINIIWGAAITFFASIFGQYHALFLGFLVLNLVDYFTGCIKARMFGLSSSVIGAKGIMKKVGYWIVIGLAFYVSWQLSTFGSKLGINLSFLVYIGWFTLASYLVNEIRSILENLVEMGVDVPYFFIKGLKVANDKINQEAEEKESEDEK